MFVAQLGAYYTDVSWNKRFTFDPCKLLNITASFEYIYTLLEALLDTPHHLWREMTSTAALEVVNSSSFLLKLPSFIWKISVNKWLEVCVLNEEKCCVSLIVLVKFLKLSVLPSLSTTSSVAVRLSIYYKPLWTILPSFLPTFSRSTLFILEWYR